MSLEQDILEFLREHGQMDLPALHRGMRKAGFKVGPSRGTHGNPRSKFNKALIALRDRGAIKVEGGRFGPPRFQAIESVQETDRGAFAPTPGLVRAAFKIPGSARQCEECGLGIPKYVGRYPSKCPRCTGAVVVVGEAAPPGRAKGDNRPHGSADGPKRSRKRRRQRVAEVRHAVAAGFKPQSPKLQELLDHAWPAAMVEGDSTPIHLIPYSAFDADDILPLLEGPEQGFYYRVEQPTEPVMLFAFNEGRLACWAERDPARFLGFDPRDQIVQEDWEGTFEVTEAGEGDYALHTNTSGEKFWGNAGAGVLPIAKTTGRILIGLRSAYVNEPGTWGVFGGAIDSGEDPKRAAKREVREELGYSGGMKLLPAFVFTSSGGGFRFSNFIGIVADEFDPVLDWETETTKWVTYDELTRHRKKHFGLEALLKNSRALIRKHAKPANESIEERTKKAGGKSQSTGAAGREFEDAFIKALHILGLQFEENGKRPEEDESKDKGDWSGPVWDIKPVGRGWYDLISGRGTNLKIQTARHAWTAGGAALYKQVAGYVLGADHGQWSQETAEKRIMAATRRMLKATGAHRTVWMKPKTAKIQNAIIRATRANGGRGDKERLRELMVKDNFASKLLGDNYKLTMKLDWDRDDAEALLDAGMAPGKAITKGRSWQSTFNIYLDGGVGGQKLGLTARIDYKGGIFTIAWRDRKKTPADKKHPARVAEGLDEGDAAVRAAERNLRANMLDFSAWDRAFAVARRHGMHIAVKSRTFGPSMVFNVFGGEVEPRVPIGIEPVIGLVARDGSQWFIHGAAYPEDVKRNLRARGVDDVWIASGAENPYGRVQEDARSAVSRPRKPGEGLTRIYGGVRFHVGHNKTRKPRKDIGRAIQNRLNARRGLGKRIKKAKEWHRSHKGAEMHNQLARYNRDGNRPRMRETIADVRERIARWSAEYQEKGYVGIEETQVGAYRYLGGGGYTSPPNEPSKTLDDTFEALLRRLIVAEALDVLQDVEFDDVAGSLYLFFDPSLPREEMDELMKALQAEESGVALIASPDKSLDGEVTDSEWWVAFLPGKGEDGQPAAPDSRVYAAVPEPGSKVQMVKMAPPTPVDQIAMDVDVGKLLKSLGGK